MDSRYGAQNLEAVRDHPTGGDGTRLPEASAESRFSVLGRTPLWVRICVAMALGVIVGEIVGAPGSLRGIINIQ